MGQHCIRRNVPATLGAFARVGRLGSSPEVRSRISKPRNLGMPMSRKAWAHYYSSQAWKLRRAHQLRIGPLCKRCGVLATVAHHVVPHKGDWCLFIEGELNSLCKRCHDSAEQMVEKRGYTNEIGIDGWPTDPRAPANRA